MSKARIIIFIILLVPTLAYGQETGILILVSDKAVILNLDGDDIGSVDKNQVKKISLPIGDHFLQAKVDSNTTIDSMFTVLPDKQLILKLNFASKFVSKRPSGKVVAEIAFDVPGLSTEEFTIPNVLSGSYFPAHAYAFEQGDDIVLNLKMLNNR